LEEPRKDGEGKRQVSEEGQVQELASHSLRRTGIGMKRKIDWGHAKALGTPSGGSVRTLGTPIHKHKVVTGQENDGMMGPLFETRQARGKDIQIDMHCPRV
jgi:hypothetical protein